MLKKYFWGLLLIFLINIGCDSKRPTVYNKRKAPKERTTPTRQPVLKETKPMVISDRDETTPEPIPTDIPYNDRVQMYIDQFAEIAKDEMVHYGIPASIKLAQGILESAAGAGNLAVRSNNHFGIKCHTGWEGERVYHDDDEKGECFRKYNHPKYSYRDHSLFLTNRSRYRDLFSLRKNDYKGWARGLRKAGYATDPRYPEKLIGIIERYNLHEYDAEVLGRKTDKKSVATVPQPEIQTYSVQPGDTLYSISRRFNLTVETLKKYNGLVEDTISVGQILYLQPVDN